MTEEKPLHPALEELNNYGTLRTSTTSSIPPRVGVCPTCGKCPTCGSSGWPAPYITWSYIP